MFTLIEAKRKASLDATTKGRLECIPYSLFTLFIGLVVEHDYLPILLPIRDLSIVMVATVRCSKNNVLHDTAPAREGQFRKYDSLQC